jgi:hypothetical protein
MSKFYELFVDKVVNNQDVLRFLEKDYCKKMLISLKQRTTKQNAVKITQLGHVYACISFCLKRYPLNPFFEQTDKKLFVPELYISYLDTFDNELNAMIRMSLTKKENYFNDLKSFLEVFTGEEITKFPNIYKFSDISFELAKYYDNLSIFKNTAQKRIADYSNKVVIFMKAYKRGKKNIEELMNRIFDFQEGNPYDFVIQKNINFHSIIEESRKVMIDFIAETDDNYTDVLDAWEHVKSIL